MLIGIDASRALRARRTGTENYSLQLIRHIWHWIAGTGFVCIAISHCPQRCRILDRRARGDPCHPISTPLDASAAER